MDFKELLPLILLIIISTIISAKKKKKQSLSQQEETPPASPWDDLLRELTGGSVPERDQPHPASATDDLPAPVIRPAQSTPWQSVVTLPDLEPYSYDQEVIADLQQPRFSYDDRVVCGGSSTDAVPVQQGAVHPTLPSDANAQSAVNKLFPGGFNPRAAILYSEILARRF